MSLTKEDRWSLQIPNDLYVGDDQYSHRWFTQWNRICIWTTTARSTTSRNINDENASGCILVGNIIEVDWADSINLSHWWSVYFSFTIGFGYTDPHSTLTTAGRFCSYTLTFFGLLFNGILLQELIETFLKVYRQERRISRLRWYWGIRR